MVIIVHGIRSEAAVERSDHVHDRVPGRGSFLVEICRGRVVPIVLEGEGWSDAVFVVRFVAALEVPVGLQVRPVRAGRIAVQERGSRPWIRHP